MIYTAEQNPKAKVFLDGIQRYDMNYADTEAGILRGFKQEGNSDNADPNGKLELRYITGECCPKVIEVEYHGAVTVVEEP